MSLLPVEAIKIVAESIGIANLKDDVAAALAQDIEYRLRDIIQEAMKFMRHSKRKILSTSDVNYALKVRNVEKLYGFSTNNSAMKFKNITVNNQNLFYLDDEELDFEDLVNAPMPKVPLDITWTAHWLAIDGVQPSIPQNPAQIETKIENLSRKLKADGKFDLLAVEQKSEVKPLVRHIVTKELQLYYEKITEALLSDSKDLNDTAIESIKEDQGIQQLMPYFLQFVSDQLGKNLKVLKTHRVVLSVLDALLRNPNLFVEPYLHQFMPPILTCIVSKSISEKPEDDHWAIRRDAADLMVFLCKTYGDAYQTLQPRVTRTLLRAFLDPLKALTSHYGAIVGLTKLSSTVVQALILPNIKEYMKILKPSLEQGKVEAKHVFNALKEAANVYIQYQVRQSNGEHENQMEVDLDYNSIEFGNVLVELFGDKIGK